MILSCSHAFSNAITQIEKSFKLFAFQEYEDNLFLQCDKCRMMVYTYRIIQLHDFIKYWSAYNPERLNNDAGSCSVLWRTRTIRWSTLAMQPVPTWGTSRVPSLLSMSSHRYIWLCCTPYKAGLCTYVIQSLLGGAMKPTTDGRWAHLACAIWIPGIIS
jgi:hypothetical protein